MSAPHPASPAVRGHLSRWVSAALVLVLVAAGGLVGVPSRASADDPAAAVAPAMDRLNAAVDAVVAAEAERNRAGADLERTRAAEVTARDRADAADQAVVTQRTAYGELGAASYRLHGGDTSTRDHQVMVSALTARRAMLKAALAEQEDASRAYDVALRDRESADRAAASAEQARAAAEADRGAREIEADQALAAVGATDLPAIAYIAYTRAADVVNAAHPDCKVPAAVLAAIGRVRWRHGRPTGPTAGLAVEDPAPGEPRGPYDVEQAITPVADGMCADGRALDTFAPLQSAVYRVQQDSAEVRVILAAAWRYSRIPGVALGVVPVDPTMVSDGVPQFDDGVVLAPGDVAGMIDWAMTRLGTPYSQCLGPDARPQDPVCPPGTNRFGQGFFDCSGFVSSAYRKIGVAVPATTYAMDADPRFMATKVADRLDPAVVQPGDVFLMDGHTGMYVGNGMIIHARGIGLTLEPIPGWVAHATYAVLRPMSLVAPPG